MKVSTVYLVALLSICLASAALDEQYNDCEFLYKKLMCYKHFNSALTSCMSTPQEFVVKKKKVCIRHTDKCVKVFSRCTSK